MTYEEWLTTVPESITADPLWKMKVYRLALLLNDFAWHDSIKLVADHRMIGVADHLFRAVGSIGANIAEGYSRNSGKDRARFYEYALGSARESRDWYYKARYILGDKIVNHRYSLLAQIIRLLLTMIPEQRGRILREDKETYQIDSSHLDTSSIADKKDLPNFLNDIPLPD